MFKQQQVQTFRIPMVFALSLLLASTIGCNRDPNVRKHKYLDSAKRYEANGKYKEAMIQLSNALKVDHDFADAHFEMAKVYLKMNNTTLAYRELNTTVGLDPKNLEARIDLGRILITGNATYRAQAEDQAKAVLAINPNYADAYILLAGFAESKGDLAEAVKDVQQAIAIDPKRADFHSGLAILEARSPDGEAQAEQELRKSAELDPKSPMPYMMLASMLEKKNDLPGAEQQFLAAIRVAPKSLQPRQALALLYLRVGDKAKAEQTLRQTIDDMPDDQGAAALLAEYYGRTGQIDQAENVFTTLNSKYPKSFAIKLTYARILMDKKEYAKASTVATDLTKTDAGNPDVEILNALLLLSNNKVDDAYSLLQKAIKDNPNVAKTQLLMARVALAKGDVAAAQTSYEQVAKLDPGSLDAAQGLVQIAIMHKDVNMLSEIADRTIKERPNFATGYLWRGMAEASRKEFDKAQADFQTVLKIEPNSPVAYLELAELSRVQGHIPESKTMLDKALEKDPGSARALAMLVSYDLQDKQPAKAIARIQAQIAKSPANGSFYTELAEVQVLTKDLKGALDSSQKAMQLDPTSARAMQLYTRAQFDLGNVDQAIAAAQNWVNSHPNDSVQLALLASLESAKGDTAKAIDLYKKALQIDPNNAAASNNLAYLMVENNQNVDVALTLAQTARRIMPDAAETADTLGWVYFYKGNYGGARDLLESAVKENPENASMQFHLGMVYSKLNDKADAQSHLKKSIALDPNSQGAKAASAELAKLG